MNTVVGGTGAGALGSVTQLAGLAGQTAGLMQQAGQRAGGAPNLVNFALSLGQSALGFLSASGLGSRDGVVSGRSPRSDQGTALAASGDGVGQAIGALFQLPGIMNTVVGNFKSDTIGIARAEQIGVSKVTNVGKTSLEKVGQVKKIEVGGRFEIEVKDVIFSTTEKHTMIASDKIILAAPGGVIEINKQGVFIKAKKIEFKANSINFKRGSDGKNTKKPLAEDCSKKK